MTAARVLAEWSEAGMRYALVGDGDAAELRIIGDADPAPAAADPLQDAATLRVSGPIRPGAGPLELRFSTSGGQVAAAAVVAGWAHRDVRSLMRGRTSADAARYAARVAGEATVAHATAFARAAEAASGASAPPRAVAWRDFLGGVERLCGHLSTLGAVADVAGSPTLRTRLARHEEQAMRLMAAATGSRIGIDVVVPGGLASAPNVVPEPVARLASDLERPQWPAAFTGMVRAITGRAIVVDEQSGDAAQRVGRLVAQCGTEARDLARQVAELADAGPIAVPLPPATGEALGHARGPHGMVWHWLRLDAGVVAGVFMADPTIGTLARLAAALPGQPVEDVPLLLASLPLSIGGVDL